MSMKSIPPPIPLLYRKTGECRGIPIFLSFAAKHRLWVLVITASVRRSNVYPQSSKNKKNIKAFLMKFSIFKADNFLFFFFFFFFFFFSFFFKPTQMLEWLSAVIKYQRS